MTTTMITIFDEAMDRVLERGLATARRLAKVRARMSGRTVADELTRVLDEFPPLRDQLRESGIVPPSDQTSVLAADLELKHRYIAGRG